MAYDKKTVDDQNGVYEVLISAKENFIHLVSRQLTQTLIAFGKTVRGTRRESAFASVALERLAYGTGTDVSDRKLLLAYFIEAANSILENPKAEFRQRHIKTIIEVSRPLAKRRIKKNPELDAAIEHAEKAYFQAFPSQKPPAPAD